MIVIDASVLVEVLLRRHEAVAALRRETAGLEHEPLHAPELIEPETLNALRKVVLRGLVSPRRATEAVSDLDRIRLVRYRHALLRGRIWELRDALSAYDAAYLAVAEALPDALLLTADRALAGVARRLLGEDRVQTVA